MKVERQPWVNMESPVTKGSGTLPAGSMSTCWLSHDIPSSCTCSRSVSLEVLINTDPAIRDYDFPTTSEDECCEAIEAIDGPKPTTVTPTKKDTSCNQVRSKAQPLVTPSSKDKSNINGQEYNKVTPTKEDNSNKQDQGQSKTPPVPLKQDTSNPQNEHQVKVTPVKKDMSESQGQEQPNVTPSQKDKSDNEGKHQSTLTQARKEKSNDQGQEEPNITPSQKDKSNNQSKQQSTLTQARKEKSNDQGQEEPKSPETISRVPYILRKRQTPSPSAASPAKIPESTQTEKGRKDEKCTWVSGVKESCPEKSRLQKALENNDCEAKSGPKNKVKQPIRGDTKKGAGIGEKSCPEQCLDSCDPDGWLDNWTGASTKQKPKEKQKAKKSQGCEMSLDNSDDELCWKLENDIPMSTPITTEPTRLNGHDVTKGSGSSSFAGGGREVNIEEIILNEGETQGRVKSPTPTIKLGKTLSHHRHKYKKKSSPKAHKTHSSGVPISRRGLNDPIVHDYIDKGEKGKRGPLPRLRNKQDKKPKKPRNEDNGLKGKDKTDLDLDQSEAMVESVVEAWDSEETPGGPSKTASQHFQGPSDFFKVLHVKRRR